MKRMTITVTWFNKQHHVKKKVFYSRASAMKFYYDNLKKEDFILPDVYRNPQYFFRDEAAKTYINWMACL